MTALRSLSDRLTELLMRHATNRLRRGRPEWADAMLNEGAALASDNERLRWAAGCAIASYRAPTVMGSAIYPAALSLGVGVMIVYEWSADESLRTLAVLGLIGLILGLVGPRRVWLSGVAVGSVVAAVSAFEALSGLRPGYETHLHTLAHCSQWLVLIAPALITSALGGFAARTLRAGPEVGL